MATRTPQPMTTLTGMDTNIIVSPTVMDGTEATTFGFDVRSTKCVGLQKLVNRVVKLLWTQKGSNPLNLSEGTDLINLYTDNIGDDKDLYSFVSICISDAVSQIKDQQSRDGARETEMLTNISLVNTRMEPSATSQIYHITISIYSAAGETATFELPSTIA